MKTEYVLGGERFNTLEEFYTEFGRVFIGGEPWGKNLNALNNILDGDFGLIPGEFRLVWRHALRSRERLGYALDDPAASVTASRLPPNSTD